MMIFWLLLLFATVLQFYAANSQQTYVDNNQLDCDNNYNNTLGYVCNNTDASTCAAYITFRSNARYNSAVTIGYLTGSDPTQIARLNNISHMDPIQSNTLVIVPVNCSCSGNYYQHNVSYELSSQTETYFSVANDTYQGLTTCQALKAQNPYDYRDLEVGMRLNIPLSCACPSSRQTAAGFRYLVSYLASWTDYIEVIAEAFGTDEQSVFQANQLSPDDLIYPFTTILVPVRSPPTYRESINSSSPELTPPTVIINHDRRSPHHTWIFVGAGIAAALAVLIFLLLVCFFMKRRRLSRKEVYSPELEEEGIIEDKKMQSVSSEGVRYAIGWLTVYKLKELQEATGEFSEANLIKGSVYKGILNGDEAAVKIMKGDVSAEMNILKQINHSNIIRLSGFCVYQDNTYLVYEYAERGSLADSLIHNQNTKILVLLNWQQRVQIAYDIADALNYLHNYSDPPYIHMNLTSSNVVLDSNFRAKIANFGQARTSNSDNRDEQLKLQLTKHVVGTHGYMAPEYVENGLVTSKIDVFAFGVVMLELLSGRKAVSHVIKNVDEGAKDEANKNNELLLCFEINAVLEGENVREKLSEFIDPCLKVHEYPLDLAYSLSVLAKRCVARDLELRPPIADVFTALSKILSSSLDWDPSDESDHSTSRSFET